MKIVLLDLDNTVIDGDYHLNAPESEFRSVVKALAHQDIQVGLCSDSATITLRQWSDRLNLTGPIVAERGAVVWNSMRKIEQIIDDEETSWFPDLRKKFLHAIVHNFPDATLMVGDATKFVKDRNSSSALQQQVFAVNGFRKASFSFFACRPIGDQSALEPDPDLLQFASALVEKIVTEQGKNKGELFWDENVQHGLLIVHAQNTEKWRGVSALIHQLRPEQVIMIGDGMADWLNLPQVEQYAVGNAHPDYKAKATFVSQQPLTAGVIECLQRHL